MPIYDGQIMSSINGYGDKYIPKKIIINDGYIYGIKDTRTVDGKFIFEKELSIINVTDKIYNGGFLSNGDQGERKNVNFVPVFTPTFLHSDSVDEESNTTKLPRMLDGSIMGGDSSSDKAPRVSPKEITWTKLK